MSATLEKPERTLTRLLVALFDAEELPRWVRQTFPNELVSVLPGGNASHITVAEAASQAILRRGELDELWRSLVVERPKRAAEIAAVRDAVLRLGAADGLLAPLVITACRRCGVPPGVRRPCLGSAPAHDFAEFVGEVFCRDCGVRPSEQPPQCTGGRSAHRFAAAAVPPRCRLCGVLVGERTACAGVAPRHEFTGLSANPGADE